MKNYKLLIDAPFTGGKVVIFNDEGIIRERDLSREKKHSVSLFEIFVDFQKEDFFPKIEKIYFNVGPGNFSSLRVVGSTAFGLLVGLGLEAEKLYGFSYLDFLVWKKSRDKTKISVAIEDNCNNWVGSTYMKKNGKFVLSDNYWRIPIDSKFTPELILSPQDIFSSAELISYLNSSAYIYRNPWELLYYQKSYFE